jgi:hypothetical protein
MQTSKKGLLIRDGSNFAMVLNCQNGDII